MDWPPAWPTFGRLWPVPKSTRYRQLRRLAERRAAEKAAARAARRERLTTVGRVGGALVAVAMVVGLGVGLANRDDAGGGEVAAPSSSPDGPGAVTGYANPLQDLVRDPGPAACGGTKPDGMLRPKEQFNAPAQVLTEGREYYATFATSCGDIVVRLFADTAPQTVNSFVFLAERNFFDGMRFHRLASEISIIQGGDPTGTGTGGPGYVIPDELTGTESYVEGVLAMANAGPNTGGSQFFFVTGPNAIGLPPAYTIFGEIVEGLDVAQRIQDLEVQGSSAADPSYAQQPKQLVFILSVTISDAP